MKKLLIMVLLFTGCVSSNHQPFREEAANILFTETGLIVVTPKHKTLSKQYGFAPGQRAKLIRTENGYQLIPGELE